MGKLVPNSQKPPKAEERKMDWELTFVSHGSTRMTCMTRWLHSHDSLARWLAVCQDPLCLLLNKFFHDIWWICG